MNKQFRQEFSIKQIPTDDALMLENTLNAMSGAGWELYSIYEAEQNSKIVYNCIFVKESENLSDEIDDELLVAMKECDKVLPYFDIPMQHANNRLLKSMNRRGTKEDVFALIHKIRTMFPDATLRTTMIVGFPGETEEEFEELIDFIKEVKWDRMGAFTYSKEEDTPAYDYPDEIDEDIQNERLSALMEIQREISLEKNKEKIGKVIEVLVEEKEGLTNRYRGRSKADAPDEVDGQVIFRCDEDLDIGSFVQVKITDAKEYDLFGIWKES